MSKKLFVKEGSYSYNMLFASSDDTSITIMIHCNSSSGSMMMLTGAEIDPLILFEHTLILEFSPNGGDLSLNLVNSANLKNHCMKYPSGSI